VAAIEQDPQFFAGYFAPYTLAGTFTQLADVELFFTQAVAAAPLTIAVMGRVMGGSLIPTFYEAVTRGGAIRREHIEADMTSLLPIWSLLRPFLEQWAETHPTLEDWHRQLLRGVIAYENLRLKFVNNDPSVKAEMAASGSNWGAFVSNVDIGAVFEAMQADDDLEPELVRQLAIVLVRQNGNAYRAYTTDVSRLGELPRHPYLAGTDVAG
jgi:hypothetical protein